MSLATVLKVCKFIKKRLNTCVFLLIFQSFRDSFFYRTTPVAAFEVSFSQRKEFQKKKKKKIVERLPLVFISLFCIQIQKPASRLQYLPFLKNLLNFIITKYLKQEVADDLNI